VSKWVWSWAIRRQPFKPQSAQGEWIERTVQNVRCFQLKVRIQVKSTLERLFEFVAQMLRWESLYRMTSEAHDSWDFDVGNFSDNASARRYHRAQKLYKPTIHDWKWSPLDDDCVILRPQCLAIRVEIQSVSNLSSRLNRRSPRMMRFDERQPSNWQLFHSTSHQTLFAQEQRIRGKHTGERRACTASCSWRSIVHHHHHRAWLFAVEIVIRTQSP